MEFHGVTKMQIPHNPRIWTEPGLFFSFPLFPWSPFSSPFYLLPIFFRYLSSRHLYFLSLSPFLFLLSLVLSPSNSLQLSSIYLLLPFLLFPSSPSRSFSLTSPSIYFPVPPQLPSSILFSHLFSPPLPSIFFPSSYSLFRFPSPPVPSLAISLSSHHLSSRHFFLPFPSISLISLSPLRRPSSVHGLYVKEITEGRSVFGLFSPTSELRLILRQDHFVNGQVKLTCSSTISHVYQEYSHVAITMTGFKTVAPSQKLYGKASGGGEQTRVKAQLTCRKLAPSSLPPLSSSAGNSCPPLSSSAGNSVLSLLFCRKLCLLSPLLQETRALLTPSSLLSAGNSLLSPLLQENSSPLLQALSSSAGNSPPLSSSAGNSCPPLSSSAGNSSSLLFCRKLMSSSLLFCRKLMSSSLSSAGNSCPPLSSSAGNSCPPLSSSAGNSRPPHSLLSPLLQETLLSPLLSLLPHVLFSLLSSAGHSRFLFCRTFTPSSLLFCRKLTPSSLLSHRLHVGRQLIPGHHIRHTPDGEVVLRQRPSSGQDISLQDSSAGGTLCPIKTSFSFLPGRCVCHALASLYRLGRGSPSPVPLTPRWRLLPRAGPGGLPRGGILFHGI
ncbi:hypothetical protein C7M84_015904 [Penaeus vannamei]|uniref:Uncharacterized protein n=1 Tax=Penaeus vannamei TaxID=6689 RepID=A0A3R7M3D1_PENVA|nr:hypothetical protein C7M84_015904 [Penaeus vannamei]